MNNLKKWNIIWVDLDEVLAELLDYLLEYNNYKIWSYSLKREEVKDYYIHKMPHLDISIEESIAWFRKPMLEDIKNHRVNPVEWAKEKLLQFKKNWYKLLILTARIEEIFWEYTSLWVQNHFPEIFDDIIFADHFHENHREKSEICKDEGIGIMIEDNYDYAMDLAKAWVTTYLIEKPWNNFHEVYHENIIRIKSWEDVNL